MSSACVAIWCGARSELIDGHYTPPPGGPPGYGGGYGAPGGFAPLPGPPPGADPQLWNWFSAVDSDRFGHISAPELCAWRNDMWRRGPARVALRQCDRMRSPIASALLASHQRCCPHSRGPCLHSTCNLNARVPKKGEHVGELRAYLATATSAAVRHGEMHAQVLCTRLRGNSSPRVVGNDAIARRVAWVFLNLDCTRPSRVDHACIARQALAWKQAHPPPSCPFALAPPFTADQKSPFLACVLMCSISPLVCVHATKCT
ncbi:uncharacterized protein SCHCODRAFT_02664734 [Schizophyllum commune H4-8]|nr:uncharacterized protein SCHCODRAFT_02664734 [Schizophyllum commune H4-8]KAI5896986.1 hypothetical protein SCHCODRAFT_02664734 [Schizophyllum commune H4-8]